MGTATRFDDAVEHTAIEGADARLLGFGGHEILGGFALFGVGLAEVLVAQSCQQVVGEIARCGLCERLALHLEILFAVELTEEACQEVADAQFAGAVAAEGHAGGWFEDARAQVDAALVADGVGQCGGVVCHRIVQAFQKHVHKGCVATSFLEYFSHALAVARIASAQRITE